MLFACRLESILEQNTLRRALIFQPSAWQRPRIVRSGDNGAIDL